MYEDTTSNKSWHASPSLMITRWIKLTGILILEKYESVACQVYRTGQEIHKYYSRTILGRYSGGVESFPQQFSHHLLS
jgi:hypothetical protein